MTYAGFSVWKYSEGKPTFQKFYSPFDKYDGPPKTEITSSGYQNGCIILKGRAFLYTIDLHQQDPQFQQAIFSDSLIEKLIQDSAKSVSLSLQTLENRLFLMYAIDDNSSKVCLRDITIQPESGSGQQALTSTESHLEFEGDMSEPLRGNEYWQLFFHSHFGKDSEGKFTHEHLIYILDIKKHAFWIGKEMNLICPDPEKGETYFINDDFLFLSYQGGGLRVIHLPTKTEYTDRLLPFLQPYLNQNTTLYAATVRFNDAKEARLDILLYIKGKEYNDLKSNDGGRTVSSQKVKPYCLQSVQIPLKEPADDQPNDPSELPAPEATPPAYSNTSALPSPHASPLLSQDTPPSTETLPTALRPSRAFPPPLPQRHVVPSSTKSCTLTDGKTIVVAGAILLLITALSSAILISLHPGSIIFKGGGVILTLPAVLTLSLGGGSSLLIIAIGSYRWWKSH